MRVMITATLPIESGNALVRDPKMMDRIQTVLAEVRPDAVYFAAVNGHRSIYVIANLDEGADIARVAEPFWLAFNASVEIVPVMAQEDIEKAGPSIAAAAQKF